MSTIQKVYLIVCSIFMFGSCAPLRLLVIVKSTLIETFKYAYISSQKN